LVLEIGRTIDAETQRLKKEKGCVNAKEAERDPEREDIKRYIK